MALVLSWLATAIAAETPLPTVYAPPTSSTDALSAREPYSSYSEISLQSSSSGVERVADRLAAAPGVILQDSGGYGQRLTVSLRGASSEGVMVLFDGVPLEQPGRAVDLSMLSLSLFERLQLVRGVAPRVGMGAMGGVVNLVSRTPADGASVSGRATVGMFGTYAADLSGTVRLGPGHLIAVGDYLQSEGDFLYAFNPTPQDPNSTWRWQTRENNASRRGNALVKYRFRAPGDTTVDVSFLGQARNRGLAGTAQNPQPTAGEAALRGLLSARTSTAFSWGGRLVTTTYGNVESVEYRGSSFFLQDRKYRLAGSVSTEARYTQKVRRQSFTLLLSGGGDWLREVNAVTTTTPAWGRFGILVADDVSFFDGRLVVGASLRVDIAGSIAEVSPQVGLAYELVQGLTMRVTGGQSSRPPSFSELYVFDGVTIPNPRLQPERARSVELAFDLDRTYVSGSVAGFYTEYENLISYEYYPPSMVRPYNFDSAMVAGVELQVAVSPFPWLRGSASYAYLFARNTSTDKRYTGLPLPFRPEHKGFVRLEVGVPLLTAKVEAVLQTGQYTNRTAATMLPGRALLALGVSSRIVAQPEINLGFEVRNILNVQTQDFDGYPLPPRAGFLTVALAWNGAKK